MSLRLIYSSNEDIEPQAQTRALNRLRLACLAAALFFAVKLPMCFVTNNPEELRDFDHYARASSGEYAYRDYAWLYGPLSPIVYGAVLKVFPERLITVRLFSLLLWSVGAAFVALLLSRYFATSEVCLLGTFFICGVLGYPSYSHNHVLAAVATIACLYYFLHHREHDDVKSLLWSFFAMAVVLFTRPILMGYGISLLWFASLFFIKPDQKRAKELVVCLLGIIGIFLVFLLIYGQPVVGSFLPKPWEVLPSKGYPNLHFLVPHWPASGPRQIELLAKQVWAALETAIFYLHFFIWPAVILTLAFVLPKHRFIKTAAYSAAFAWVASLDLLHYGFSDPLSEQAMWVRGQYFFALMAFSLFLQLYPAAVGQADKVKRSLAQAVLVLVLVWSYFPYLLGLVHLSRFEFNHYKFPALSGILTHPDRSYTFAAIEFINSQCEENDTVVVPQYDPGLGRLLKCREVFGRDAYIFTRSPSYHLSAGETPYAPSGGTTNGDLITRMIASSHPRFYLMQGSPELSSVCDQPGWSSRWFGEGANGRRVCYGPKQS